MDEFKKYLQNNREGLDLDEPDAELWTGVRDKLHPPKSIGTYMKWMTAACIVVLVGSGLFYFNSSGTKGREQAGNFIIEQPSPEVKLTDTIRSQPTQEENRASGPAIAKKERKPRKSLPSYRDTLPKQHIAIENPFMTKTKQVGRQATVQVADTTSGFETIEASYAVMLNIQLERLKTLPIYAESPEHFSFFKDQFNALEKQERDLKQQFSATLQKDQLLDDLISIYQRKITVLKQLQFEINKMNNRVKQMNTGIQIQTPSFIKL